MSGVGLNFRNNTPVSDSQSSCIHIKQKAAENKRRELWPCSYSLSCKIAHLSSSWYQKSGFNHVCLCTSNYRNSDGYLTPLQRRHWALTHTHMHACSLLSKTLSRSGSSIVYGCCRLGLATEYYLTFFLPGSSVLFFSLFQVLVLR